jgi:ABC-type Fe3+ transport system substrate-binding protein
MAHKKKNGRTKVAAGATLVVAAAYGGGAFAGSGTFLPSTTPSDLPTHEEIVAAAEDEPSGLVALTISGDLIGEALADSFNEKYPFAEVEVLDSGSSDAQTVQLELAAGRHESDVVRLFEPQWDEYTPYLADYDLRALAEAGSLDIPIETIEPGAGQAAYSAVFLGATVYNPDRMADYGIDMSTVTTFEELADLCDGPMPPGQMTEDLGPDMFASLGVALGLDGLEAFAADLNERCELVFLDGNTPRATAVSTGEYALSVTGNHHAALEVQRNGGNLEITFLEPIPGLATGMVGINGETERPNMSLLYIEHLFSPEGQAILNELLPSGSLLIEDNAGHSNYDIVAGRETSIDSWDTLATTPERNRLLQEVWGFPSN